MRDWDFDGQLARTLRISGFILVFFCLALVSRPKDPVTWGFLVGTAVSMWNAFFLARRLRAIVDMAVPMGMARAKMRFGFFLRFTIILAVLFFVARVGGVNPYAAVTGLFVVPCVFTFSAVGILLREARDAKSLK